MLKATQLLEGETPIEDDDDRKMPAVPSEDLAKNLETKVASKEKKEDDDDDDDDDDDFQAGLSMRSPDSDETLLRWETHNQKKEKITEEEIQMVEMIQFNESQGSTQDNTEKSYTFYGKNVIANVPSTDCCQRNMWNMLVTDRGEGMFWEWKEPQYDFLPLRHEVNFDDDELEEKKTDDSDEEEDPNNSSQALLTPEQK